MKVRISLKLWTWESLSSILRFKERNTGIAISYKYNHFYNNIFNSNAQQTTLQHRQVCHLILNLNSCLEFMANIKGI